MSQLSTARSSAEGKDDDAWYEYFGFDEEQFDEEYKRHFQEYESFRLHHDLIDDIGDISQRRKRRMKARKKQILEERIIEKTDERKVDIISEQVLQKSARHSKAMEREWLEEELLYLQESRSDERQATRRRRMASRKIATCHKLGDTEGLAEAKREWLVATYDEEEARQRTQVTLEMLRNNPAERTSGDRNEHEHHIKRIKDRLRKYNEAKTVFTGEKELIRNESRVADALNLRASSGIIEQNRREAILRKLKGERPHETVLLGQGGTQKRPQTAAARMARQKRDQLYSLFDPLSSAPPPPPVTKLTRTEMANRSRQRRSAKRNKSHRLNHTVSGTLLVGSTPNRPFNMFPRPKTTPQIKKRKATYPKGSKVQTGTVAFGIGSPTKRDPLGVSASVGNLHRRRRPGTSPSMMKRPPSSKRLRPSVSMPRLDFRQNQHGVEPIGIPANPLFLPGSGKLQVEDLILVETNRALVETKLTKLSMKELEGENKKGSAQGKKKKNQGKEKSKGKSLWSKALHKINTTSEVVRKLQDSANNSARKKKLKKKSDWDTARIFHFNEAALEAAKSLLPQAPKVQSFEDFPIGADAPSDEKRPGSCTSRSRSGTASSDGSTSSRRHSRMHRRTSSRGWAGGGKTASPSTPGSKHRRTPSLTSLRESFSIKASSPIGRESISLNTSPSSHMTPTRSLLDEKEAKKIDKQIRIRRADEVASLDLTVADMIDLINAAVADESNLALLQTDTSPRSKRRQEMMRPRPTDLSTIQWMLSRSKLLKKKVNANKKIRYRLIFDLLDDDKSGTLDFDELYGSILRSGLKVTREELTYLMRAIDAGYDALSSDLSFDDFVNGFASINEWDRLYEIHVERRKKGIDEPVIPLVQWVPALHRSETIDQIMKLEFKSKDDRDVLSLREKMESGATLADQWKYVQGKIREKHEEEEKAKRKKAQRFATIHE